MKVIRYAIYAVIALLLLAVAAVAIAVAVINPNDYKPQIEAAVEKQTNLDLMLEGDIGWSFIPLGLELNQVEANLDGERFVALEQLIAQIDFWSLIAMSPQVNTFLLNGLDARLEVNEQGEGNWTRIMREKSATAEADTDAAEQQPAQETAEPEPQSTSGEALNFNVENVEISNASVHYNDLSTGQSVTLEDFTVTASDITLGSEFPLDIRFRVETSQPQFAVDGSIKARIQANQELNEFAVSGLNAVFDMSGEPFGGESVTAELAGSLAANLENETASLSDFSASLANLSLNTNLNVKGFGDKPALEGRIEISEFSLKELLNNLGQPAIETTDPEVLKAIALSTNLGGEPGVVALSDLVITLDDTRFNGGGSYNLATGGLVFDLEGDKLNADRYLPPSAEGDSQGVGNGDTQTDSNTQTAGASQPETDLLPLETLRTLLLDIDFGLGELIVSNLTINDIAASTTAKDGLLQVDEFSGKLYYGSFGANATIDARTDNPKWRIRSDVTNVQTLPLLTDLAEVDMLSGGANLKVAVDTTGNRISALRENANGEISFNLAEGEFRQMNLTRMACQGIALANQESLTTTDWGTTTPFNDMRGTLKIDGNTLNNTDLVAALAGMRLEGNGTVDLEQTDLDYELSLRIVGEIHRDEACRVTEYVENVVIPVECRGNFAEDPAGLCSFDGSRFRDTLKDIAANAAKAKAREEVDRAKEKAEEKVQEKLKEKLGEDAGEKVKDALKGLFN
ncbi:MULTISPECIES: AsmA family protein [Marinobacter]|jgi:AsmA protein|uniref:A/G-specific adenine glycosylase n=2 Tax=Marinobacter nauticus TaxID=2743 RepID=A0A833JLC3_MARNT|nr:MULTISPECIES: AsmA family protein [Marinobacter]MEC9386953.1 AsmA family protein [Pseudomonadota bacterium]KAE8543904.1 A/G-specific adenine glycosylase [Marinobacter nauticus]MAC22112.1 AsmA family protein [Marinobacter sp.]MAC24824.1 AsmA family protein [Marinobacter sp.]MAL32818.1 AsmA family protein [Marinobacter sp.]|tara:strand:- start:3182 stop:5407 length:2226 start_codon:yes stop_codon:yes gene_type:complete